MSASDEAGKFQTNIGDDVIQDALRSVERAEAALRGDAPEASATEARAAEPKPPSDFPNAEETDVSVLRAELDLSLAKGRELMAKVKDEHEKMLRAVADLDNFKKRATKEKEEIQKFGIEKLLKDFIPVADNFDRALEHAATATDFDGLRKGVEMVRKMFDDTLTKHGVTSFSSKGQLFDPNKHEAMSATETDDLPPNHVVSEMLRGYLLNERLVRPALVVISRPKAHPHLPNSPPPEGAPPEET